MLIALPGLFLACNEDDSLEDPFKIAKKMESLKAEIESLVNLSCSAGEGVLSCAAIGLGAKPCGGHWEYLIYSAEATDVDLLDAKVAEYNILSEAYNERTDAVSDCMLVVAPTLDCFDGVCQVSENQ